MIGAPDLPPGQRIDRHGRVVRGRIDDAVLDDGEAFGAAVVGDRIAPDRHQLGDVLLVDLGQRAVALSGIAHAVDEHVARREMHAARRAGSGRAGRRGRHRRHADGFRRARLVPDAIDPAAFASPDALRAGNRVMADLGPRPTAGTEHEAFIRWVERRLRRIPGVEMRTLPDRIARQLEKGASLRIGDEAVPVAGAVPYAAPTPAPVTAPLLYVPPGTAVSAADAAGKIVVRDVVPGVIQYAVFGAVAYFVHDPDRSFDYSANYERDWISAVQRITDLEEAQAAGAAGLVFVHTLPRDQVAGHYAPYPGVPWDVPAVYLGADEGERLKEAATASPSAAATMTLAASRRMAPTRTVVGRLPGQSNERIVIESHTDGMNAVWDNGPIAILALAEYFARLPQACRPRTLEFVFTTAHLHLSHSGAVRYADMLDHEYDQGTIALVVALEHLGAKEFSAVERADGGPGRRLAATGQSEMFATFVIESPVLIQALIGQVAAHDLRRTFVLRGADAPAVAFPPHRSYGGEGGPYREKLIPTVAAITGPWTLFDPAFGLDELVDFELMRRQTLAFGDLVLAVDDVPRQVLAGLDNVYRPGRDLTEGVPLPTVPAGSSCRGSTPRSSTWRRRRSSATCRACRSTSGPTTRTTSRSPRGATRSSAACTCSSRCAAGCATCRSASTTRSGSRTPTSTSTSTSATPPCRRPASDEQLAELVARIIGRPLDRTPAAVGELRHRGPARRPLRASSPRSTTPPSTAPSGAELLTLMLDGDPEGDEIAAARRTSGGPSAVPTDGEVLAAGRRQPGPQARPGRRCSAARTVRELGKATRNPVVVAAANQVRDGLRGPARRGAQHRPRARRPRARSVGPLPVAGAPRTPFNAAITAAPPLRLPLDVARRR